MLVKAAASSVYVRPAVHSEASIKAGRNSNIAKFSPGSKINSAADDAAGLGIAERLKSRASGQQLERPAASNSEPATSDGVPNTAGAPEDAGRGQAIQRYRADASTTSSNSAEAILKGVRG